VRIAHSKQLAAPEGYLWPLQGGKKLIFMYEILDKKKWQ
jgi:hypothetical protein